MEIRLLKDEYDKWDKYVLSSPYSCSYHLIGWKKVIEKSFKHKTFYLMALQDNNIVGILPLVSIKSFLFGNFIISLPFLNYGGVCADDLEIERELIEKGIEIAKEENVAYLELRYMRKIEMALPVKEHKVTMILDLMDTPEKQWASYKPTVRNQVRKAEKEGLKFKTGGIEYLDDFYKVFSRNMRDLGTPVYHKDFFKNILEIFPQNTNIHNVYLSDKVVAGGISFSFKDTLEVPWASSIKDYIKLCPNNLLYKETIEFACKNSFKYFDFGRSSPDSGTYRFKLQWGAKPKQLYWYYWLSKDRSTLPNLSPKNSKYELFINLWKKLPLFVSNFLGPYIVRNIP